MSKITQIVYRRKYFLGGYETEDLELTVEVGPNDDPIAALGEMKEFIEFHRTPITPLIESPKAKAAPEINEPLTEKLRKATQARKEKLSGK